MDNLPLEIGVLIANSLYLEDRMNLYRASRFWQKVVRRSEWRPILHEMWGTGSKCTLVSKTFVPGFRLCGERWPEEYDDEVAALMVRNDEDLAPIVKRIFGSTTPKAFYKFFREYAAPCQLCVKNRFTPLPFAEKLSDCYILPKELNYNDEVHTKWQRSALVRRALRDIEAGADWSITKTPNGKETIVVRTMFSKNDRVKDENGAHRHKSKTALEAQEIRRLLLSGAEGYGIIVYEGAIGGASSWLNVVNRHGKITLVTRSGQAKPFYVNTFSPFVPKDTPGARPLSDTIPGLRPAEYAWLLSQAKSFEGAITYVYLQFKDVGTSIGSFYVIENFINGETISNDEEM